MARTPGLSLLAPRPGKRTALASNYRYIALLYRCIILLLCSTVGEEKFGLSLELNDTRLLELRLDPILCK